MGNSMGGLRPMLARQKGNVRCVPDYPYQPFPEQQWTPNEDGLVMEFQALPASMARTAIPDDTFWWTDAQFLPYNDAYLVVTATAYLPGLQGAWTAVKRTPKGRILVFDLQFDPISGRYITGTESTGFPKVSMHPLGVAVGYAGISEARVDSLSGETIYTRPRDMENRVHKFAALSPNGQLMAVLSHATVFFYLEIFHLDVTLIKYTKPINLQRLCPTFQPGRNHGEHVECKWSPDSSHLAISTSSGKLFIISKFSLTTICDVFTDILDGELLSSAGSYDFDPRSAFSKMTVGSREGVLSVLCTVCERGEGKDAAKQQTDTGETIDCVQYNPDGTHLAVSFRNFTIKVYDADDLSPLRDIDLTSLCGRRVELYQHGSFPTVNRLNFSSDGRYLVTCSCDGKVRVWTVPRMLTLQEWCRKSILRYTPISDVGKSYLPNKIKSFLLSHHLCQTDLC